jgi:eukaryotic-like serine/threonine-protein kinase
MSRSMSERTNTCGTIVTTASCPASAGRCVWDPTGVTSVASHREGMGVVARGQRVGRYELVHLLGEGGMGTVWLGHPFDAPDQLFAIKTVSAQYASDPRVCTMFIKEASLAASIDHPNVVRLFDVGLHDDVPFFVMEWIDGYSLRNVARTVSEVGERVPASIALRIASDLCGGLHAAHELRGDDGEHLELVHRDVSPHNVLVTREGIAKLIDFGVAKARDLATGGSEASVCGGIKGKVRYMAPEQALEKAIDRRADLFSVGAIIYQLLTGRAPFEGPNELAIINSLLSTNPVYVPEDLPEPVQWILRRALARRPEQRFGDAAEMQNAIELALVELGQPDTHADVAQTLAWFDPDEDEDEPTRAAPVRVSMPPPITDSDRDVGTLMRPQTPSQPPPQLAYSMPTNSIPARRSSLVDDDELANRQRHASSASSWRFVLLGAGFVGLLGVGAALLVRDAPPSARSTKPGVQVGAAIDNSPPPTPGAFTPTGPSTHTPIIDMGDLDDRGGAKPSTKPRLKRAPSAGTVQTGPTASTAKTGDIAGPIKVWK